MLNFLGKRDTETNIPKLIENASKTVEDATKPKTPEEDQAEVARIKAGRRERAESREADRLDQTPTELL